MKCTNFYYFLEVYQIFTAYKEYSHMTKPYTDEDIHKIHSKYSEDIHMIRSTRTEDILEIYLRLQI